MAEVKNQQIYYSYGVKIMQPQESLIFYSNSLWPNTFFWMASSLLAVQKKQLKITGIVLLFTDLLPVRFTPINH